LIIKSCLVAAIAVRLCGCDALLLPTHLLTGK